MNFTERVQQAAHRGHVCVGLDPDPAGLPEHVSRDKEGIGRYLGAIIEATSAYAVAYKPNAAFFEAFGSWGWEILESLRGVIPSDKLLILDAKRGDVGHTASRYAHSAFSCLGADAITLSPYLGEDSLAPFLSDPERGAFLLCLTSNAGAERWQKLDVHGRPLYLAMAAWAETLNVQGNVGLVAGATRPEALTDIREVAPDLPLLIPGVGAQAGDLEATIRAVQGTPYLINASRSIAGASRGKDFADAAAGAASALQHKISFAEGAVVRS